MIPSLACLLLVLQSPVRDVGAELSAIQKQNDVPALAALALRGDEIIGQGAVGVRERGSETPVTLGDLWHLGSCTKAMTATLAAILVEEGKLKWDTKLFAAFPALEAKAKPGWKEETLADLLMNRGGMPTNLDADGLWGRLWKAKGTPREQRLMLLEGVLAQDPVAPPGTKFVYSNANFASAGAMCEQIAGKDWEALVTAKLFGPLGMKSAGFGPPGSKDELDQPRGHEASGAPIRAPGVADNPESITPAGRVHCTIADWSKFVALHLAGARAARGLAPEKGLKLLSKESFERLHASPEGPDSGYAMGWGVTKRPWGGNLLVHSGSNNLWFCVVWIAPEKNFAALACCNQGGAHGEKACDDAVGALIRLLLEPEKK